MMATTAAEADAKAREIKLQITNKEKLETARSEAEAISLMAQANFERISKENNAAASMSEQQYQLQMANQAVEAMGQLGKAAWRHPDKILQFYESFSKYLRLGPMTAPELLGEMVSKEQLRPHTRSRRRPAFSCPVGASHFSCLFAQFPPQRVHGAASSSAGDDDEEERAPLAPAPKGRRR